MQYEDKDVLSLLRYGSPFAGDIPKCETFEELYKPYMLTMLMQEHWRSCS